MATEPPKAGAFLSAPDNTWNVKIVREENLISCGEFAGSKEWQIIREKLHKAIRAVEWPPGSGSFTIYPQSGKKRGEGNGVVPIKQGLMIDLKKQGWNIEEPAKLGGKSNPGDYDAMLETKFGPVVVEWETGNISSSHRSLNKMSLAIMRGKIAAGILIVPSRELYKYLTDRVGNMKELEPYLDLWKAIPCKHGGVLEIVAIEHDATSMDVPRIRKGTDGRALA
jgi:Restriction endonuclease BamHI